MLSQTVCPTLCDPMDCSLPGSSVHGDYPGKNIGIGCHALLQEGSLPTQIFHIFKLHFHEKMFNCGKISQNLPS